ncbi:MAG: hypothetical protein AB2792_14625 [Candidatus Thiodiazotropha sp.]
MFTSNGTKYYLLLIFIYFSIHNAHSRITDQYTFEEESSEQLQDCSSVIGEDRQRECYCNKSPFLCDDRESRFSSYKPNYAIRQSTDDDDSSFEVRYSLRYNFLRPHCMPIKKPKNKNEYIPELDCLRAYEERIGDIFFTFTGEFDFYLGTRGSSPVINRLSNPAFNFRKHFEETLSYKSFTIEWVNLSIEHRSNGQSTNADEMITDPASSDFGRFRAQIELEAGNHEYFDSISRSANYIAVESKINFGKDHSDNVLCDTTFKCINTWVSAKLYLSDESDVFWGDQADKGVDIEDYDRIKIIVSDTFNTNISSFPTSEIGFEWTIGDEFLETDSLDFYIVLPWVPNNNFRLPLYLRAHYGPMSTLSDYTKDQNSIGIGLVFK